MVENKIHTYKTATLHIKDVYLDEIHLGILDTRSEGTFKTSYIDFFFFKKVESDRRIGISEILLKASEIKFEKVILEYENIRYTTERKNFIKPEDTNKYEFKGQTKLRLPFSAFKNEEIQLSLFNDDEVCNEK